MRQILVSTACILMFLAPTWNIAADIYTVAGSGAKGYSKSAVAALQAELADPFGITRGPDGLLYFCEFNGHVVRRINSTGNLEIVAGTPGVAGYEGDGGDPTKAKLNLPHEIRFDAQGDLYISDMSNHVIRKVNMKSNRIETYAGTGVKGFTGDNGPANQARFNDPISIQFDASGDLWICDIGNQRLRVVDSKTQIVKTICGNGEKSSFGSQAVLANSTPLKGPRTIDFDAKGMGWLALREGNQVYRIDTANKTLTLVAGTGESGDAGDGGSALSAKLKGPKGIAVSPDGKHVYLADTENHKIRRIDTASGTIDLVAGTGKKHDGPDGSPTECGLARPHGVYLDANGTLYIGDSENHRVRAMLIK